MFCSRLIVALFLCVSALIAACGNRDDLDGLITISGSSTLQPMMSLVAGGFAQDHPYVRIDLDSPGTADGFELFCDGLTHINDASRRINQREQTECERSGVAYVELAVAIDAIVVFTSAQNDGVDCLTLDQLYALVGPESAGVDTWDAAGDVAGVEAAMLPSSPLQVVGPGSSSGTRATFIELAISPIADSRDEVADLRPDYSSFPSAQSVIAETLRRPTSLGFIGYPALAPWGSEVKRLAIDGGDGCVAPTEDKIESGEYPLTRTLYVYVNLYAVERRPSVRAFVDYLLSKDGLAQAPEAGSVALSADTVSAVRDAWSAAR